MASAQPAATAGEAAAQIDRLFAAVVKPDQAAVAVIVVRNGKTLFRKAYGMANLELQVPARPEMVFRIGSVTKQFTSAAIMMLVEQGKLALTDAITKVLPDYPTEGKTITIEHLLTHTSGIQSYTDSRPRHRGMQRRQWCASGTDPCVSTVRHLGSETVGSVVKDVNGFRASVGRKRNIRPSGTGVSAL